ncbi:hypothetical protein PIB30_099953 [Stylosanthes scabra]|uniref:MARVEL domain-containing protein n=1 Tax=Stylosanthes scabra TaxID=79078 RepID=A0ABU6YVZ6_9FABA|nr:hypothetical protein [Stylosanthes scabra]
MPIQFLPLGLTFPIALAVEGAATLKRIVITLFSLSVALSIMKRIGASTTDPFEYALHLLTIFFFLAIGIAFLSGYLPKKARSVEIGITILSLRAFLWCAGCLTFSSGLLWLFNVSMANRVLYIGNLLLVFGLAVTTVAFLAWVYKFGIVAMDIQPQYTQPQGDREALTEEHANTEQPRIELATLTT